MTPSHSRRFGLPFAFAATLLLSVAAQAHPGHALGDHGAAHLMGSPYHLLVLAMFALLGLALFVAGRFIHNRTSRLWLRGAGLCLASASAVCWGLLA